MTIESRELFELCKQVYEATGWENTKDGFFDGGEVIPFTDRIGAYIGASNFRCPLYTSDYLLEKLPPIIEHNCFAMIKDKNDRYEAGYTEYGSLTSRSDESDTPLKALLKLTLRLHDEGLL